MGLPGAAEAGDWKHGRRHGYERHHGDSKHYGRSKHHGHHYEHRGKSHHGSRGYSHGWSGHRGHHDHHVEWYGHRGSHRRHHHHHYPTLVSASAYFDAPCGYRYESWDLFSHHVHHHHGVAFVDLPGLLVQTHSGFVFHR
jgi:hypothetical protein